MRSITHELAKLLPTQYNKPFDFSNVGFTGSLGGGGGITGGWKELGRTTLGSDTSAVTISSLATKRYNMILGSPITDASGFAGAPTIRLGNSTLDTGNNYASRTSLNDAADATVVSQSSARLISINEGYTNELFGFIGYITNYATKEKLIQGHYVNRGGVGAGNAPDQRSEFASKWANTSNVFDILSFLDAGGNNCKTGSEVVVLGYDPTDVHTTNFWEELASTTLGGNSATIDSGTFTAKKYLWIQAYIKPSGTIDPYIRLNGDTGSTTAHHVSINGGADGTGVSSAIQFGRPAIGTSVPLFMNGFIINNSANEKLGIFHYIEQNTAGAGNAPARYEVVSKWANTSNQITQIEYVDNGAGTDYGSGSILKVWGSN